MKKFKQLFGKYYDKLYHFIAGAVIAVLSIFFLGITEWSEFIIHAIAFCAVIIGGALKEFKDWKDYGYADMYDIIATILGGILIIGIDKFML